MPMSNEKMTSSLLPDATVNVLFPKLTLFMVWRDVLDALPV